MGEKKAIEEFWNCFVGYNRHMGSCNLQNAGDCSSHTASAALSKATPLMLIHKCWVLLQVDGQVTYNGKDFSQFVVERTAAYVSQVC